MTTDAAKALCAFIDASPSAYHAVASAESLLRAAGAVRLEEGDAWKLERGALYYLVRDGASLVAFRTGQAAPEDAGFALAGAHSDFPGLRARLEKPVSARGLERVAVEAYGGPIHSSWLDRPLSLAGRVALRGTGGRIETRLVDFARPVAVIPNLAIHFNREMNKGVEYPMNSALLPLVSVRGQAPGGEQAQASWVQRALAAELGIPAADILAADLGFLDAAPSFLFGEEEELLSAPRIDNLEGCHAVLSAFLSAPPAAHGQVAVLFDNEEIGSGSLRGADSSFLRDIVDRICALSGKGPESAYRALSRSLNVSVDGAQGWHPSHADKFDEEYAPLLNRGPAVKANANNRYATDAAGEAAFRACCQAAGAPCQRFRMRADLVPGSTIGPVSSALLGARTVDVGVPMLAMHAARETAGSLDHGYMIAALAEFYEAGPGLL